MTGEQQQNHHLQTYKVVEYVLVYTSWATISLSQNFALIFSRKDLNLYPRFLVFVYMFFDTCSSEYAMTVIGALLQYYLKIKPVNN